MDKQAEELNRVLKKNKVVYNLLSEKGKEIFFPKSGILGQTAEAKGKKINATIGAAIEDDGTIMRLNSIASKISIYPKDAFPYAPSYGKLQLRKRWKKLIKEKNPSLEADISLPVVTSALTHGLSMVGYMFLDKGDTIIMPDKFWGNYKLIFEKGYGANIETFEMFDEGAFNTEGFKEKLSSQSGKVVVLLNFPNNPTGYTPTKQEMEDISMEILRKAEEGAEVLVICDDAYFGLVYEDEVFEESIFSKLADLHKNILAVKVDGATKEDYVWGFRVGFITYGNKNCDEEQYKALVDKTAGAIRGNISSASHLGQSLVLEGLSSDKYSDEKDEKFVILKSRYETVKQVLSEDHYSACFKALPFNSGYFMCVELEEGIDSEKLRKVLLEKYDTGVIAIGNIIRIAYSSVSEEDIPLLFDNMYNACKDIIGVD